MIEGKVGIVTGASKGIGFAITKKLLSQGAKVYAISRTSGLLSSLDEGLKTKLRIIEQDVTDFGATKELFQSIKREGEGLDFLVNNAGIVSYELISMIDFTHFNSMLQTNITSVIQYSQLAYRLMSRNKKGSIVNISSLVSTRGAAGQAAYSASKGAVNSFTKSASKEFAAYKIRVNALAPGMVGTDRFKGILEEKFSEKIHSIGFSRLAEPDEIADACLFLIGDSSQYITGQIIELDGSTTL